LAVLVAAPAGYAADDKPVWLAGAQKKDDPRVLAFYDAQCAQYADRNALTEKEGREAFVAKCRESIAGVFPVGYAVGGGGGGGE
jgi:hypothetical protein